MGKDSALTLRIDSALRREIEKCAREEKTSISEIAEQALRLFADRRALARRRRRNIKKALAALEEMSGSVSHGSLAQNIDEELYGPMR
jgi:hypothetical protein